MLEATVTPLTTLPTAHPSPEVVRARSAAVRRPRPMAIRSAEPSPRFTTGRLAAAR